MPIDTIRALAEARRGFVTAAAGCGKTEAIARAVAMVTEGRQLVLTHTHAGVKALRDRLAGFGVPHIRFRVETIAGWALRYAANYPGLSGLEESKPSGAGWSEVYGAALRALSSSAITQVVAESYTGLYVDEYQDCTKGQHQLVMRLADLLPCRVLGDPLQGIFGFREGERLVDWPSDIEPHFEQLPSLERPWRWKDNPALGKRLGEIRESLLRGDEIDLTVGPIVWRPCERDEQVKACYARAHSEDESVVAIYKTPESCHYFARGLRGVFTSMEEMDCKALLSSSMRIEAATGLARCKAVIDFACECMTGISTELSTVREKLTAGVMPELRRVKKHPHVVQALTRVASDASLESLPGLLRAIDKVPHRLYRRELWREMQRSVGLYLKGTGESLRDAAWQLRNKVRRQGRSVELRTVSRTLLIKGLEFDHAIVLDASEHDAENLYVALTRGSRSLTVCCSGRKIRVPAPTWSGPYGRAVAPMG
jgi:DNA helicase-2/ATP-dependent DNA helicase PcrA